MQSKTLMDPKKIKFQKTAFCTRHARYCNIPDLEKCLVVLGAPCVLFSRFLDLNTFQYVCFYSCSMKDAKQLKKITKNIDTSIWYTYFYLIVQKNYKMALLMSEPFTTNSLHKNQAWWEARLGKHHEGTMPRSGNCRHERVSRVSSWKCRGVWPIPFGAAFAAWNWPSSEPWLICMSKFISL